MMITTLDHVQLAIPEGGESRARDFYGHLLKMLEIPKPPVLAARGGVWFAMSDGRQLHLGVESDFRASRKAHPCFLCSDLDALILRLEKADVLVKHDALIPPVRRFYTEDPFGNRLEFADRPSS